MSAIIRGVFPHFRGMLPPVHSDDGSRRNITSSGAIAISADEPTPMLVRTDTVRRPTIRDEEEQALIERCLGGDMEAFRPLVHRYQRLAFSVALRMLGSRTDAEDVAQQA